ncbi:MAG: diguanylate cyclase [Thiohalophilus sp.]
MPDRIRDKTVAPYSSKASLLDSLHDGVIVVDRDARVTFLNDAARQMLGISPKIAVGCQLSQIFKLQQSHPKLDSLFIRQCIVDGQPVGPFLQQLLAKNNHQMSSIDFSVIPLDGVSAAIIFHDVGHIVQYNYELRHQINYDPLTNLPNRDAIQQSLAQLHAQQQQAGEPYTILLLDLDRFKLINDNHGHSVGDLLLQHIANHLGNLIRQNDLVGRWGGEEFLCILPGTSLENGLKIAEDIRKKISEFSVKIQDREIFTTASIGVANYPEDGETVADVLKVLDAALYEAKREGRNRISSSQDKQGTFLGIATRLENALQENRILPAYQCIVDLQTGQQIADEALARIVSPNSEPLPAEQFIDAAVHLQLVHRIDYEITRQVILHCTTGVMQGESSHPHFVNISAELLRHPELVQGILDTAMRQCQACGDRLGSEKPLVIEITEQALLHSMDETRRILEPFLDFGLRLAIDDFGVGYSSLNYLADLPVSFLKIDGELVKRVVKEKKVRSIIKGIQAIADDLDLITIGEFIENHHTLEILRDLGIKWGQGYYFGKPKLQHDRFDI